MNSCSHPHVLVTGASSGIGRATALRLAVTSSPGPAGPRMERRMAILAAVLPTPALDALRRRLGGQPAPGSRADAPQPARAAEPAMR